MLKGLSRRQAPRVLILLALCALAGSAVGGGASAAGPAPIPAPVPASFARACADPPPGELACFALHRTTGVLTTIPVGVDAAATVGGFGPSDLAGAYKLPTNLGSGKTVAIVDAYDDPNAESDLADYRSQFGLPACTTANGCFRKVNQNGGASPLPAANAGWAPEIALDLDMVSAICPKLPHPARRGRTASRREPRHRGEHRGGRWARSPSPTATAGPRRSSDPSVRRATTTTRASRSPSRRRRRLRRRVPGRLALRHRRRRHHAAARATNARGWTETAWSRRRQRLLGLRAPSPPGRRTPAARKRTVADVSAVADPNTGVAVYDSVRLAAAGSSSAAPARRRRSSPRVYALAGARQRPAPPGLLPVRPGAALRRDERQQRQLRRLLPVCTGGAGYDGPTGLGTPNGVAAFAPPSSDFSVSASPIVGDLVAPGLEPQRRPCRRPSRPATPNRCR